MPLWPPIWLQAFDRAIAGCAGALLFPLAIYILISGFDDLLADILAFWTRRATTGPAPLQIASVEPAIAILVPLWQESAVIAAMLNHNLAAIDYTNYHVFLGVYPNDEETVRAAKLAVARHPRVHLAMVPHGGPTSKGDCLNWVFQQLLVWEEEHGERFEYLLIHDAEDLIHPGALAAAAKYGTSHDMVQMPVLPLKTPWHELTHGVYCDDFAESQGKDLAARVRLGGFLPGCGVGTSFRREAMERLATRDANRLFSPTALTEDYDNGLRLHQLGCSQLFLPLEFIGGAPVATREHFPRTFAGAVRQRTRWITGNALQMWERHGWPGGWRQAWFLWRDRKGLWGNPASLLCNLILIYGAISGAVNASAGLAWPLAERLRESAWLNTLLWVNMALFVERMAVRSAACARVYGWSFACGTPPRMIWGNAINSLATVRALAIYFRARWAGEPLRWVKTEHAYPSRAALTSHKRRLGEILVAGGTITREQLDRALASQTPGVRLGEHLVALGWLGETELYAGLALQQSLPRLDLGCHEVSSRAARAVPAGTARRLRVLPFRIADGALDIAGPELPGDDLHEELSRFTRLEIRFHLVTPSNFDRLEREFLTQR